MLVVTSLQKSSDKSLVTFQSLSSCCSVDLYFSRLEVTVSLKRTSIPIPKSWCPPRTGHANSSLPLCWSQGLSVSALHYISFLTPATEVAALQGPSQDVLHPTPISWAVPSFPSAHTREAQVVSWKCSLGQISILTSLLPPKLLRQPAAGRSQLKSPK